MELCFTCWWCLWNSVLFHKIFSDFFFQDQDQDSTSKINNKSYALCFDDTHKVWCRPAKFFSKSKSRSRWGSGSGSWFNFGFQYQTYISYIEDTHQILVRSANCFESYCVHSKSPRTDRQTDGMFFCLFCLLRNTEHEHSSKGENLFFHSCDYNTFCFYIRDMWWESRNRILEIKKNFAILLYGCVRKLIFFVEFWKKDRLLKIWKIIHTCRRMSMLQILLDFMKITINIVNNIHLYDDCSFKIPMLWFPIWRILTSICIYRIYNWVT